MRKAIVNRVEVVEWYIETSGRVVKIKKLCAVMKRKKDFHDCNC